VDATEAKFVRISHLSKYFGSVDNFSQMKGDLRGTLASMLLEMFHFGYFVTTIVERRNT